MCRMQETETEQHYNLTVSVTKVCAITQDSA